MHRRHRLQPCPTRSLVRNMRCRKENPQGVVETCGARDPEAVVEGWVVAGAAAAGGAASVLAVAVAGVGASSPPAAGRSGMRTSRYVAPAAERSARIRVAAA